MMTYYKLLEDISTKLERLNIPYMIIGGQAVLIYGEPRFTKDIDITLGAGINELKKILSLCNSLNLTPLIENINDFVSKTMVLPVSDPVSNLTVDFIFSFTDFEKEALNRAVDIQLETKSVKFASVEDLIIHKIFSGREIDLIDVKSIILKNPAIDKSYIIHWLNKFSKGKDEDLTEKFNNLIN